MAPLHHSSSWQIVRCLQWLICHVNLLTLLRLLLVCLANATGFGSCNILFKIAKKKSLERCILTNSTNRLTARLYARRHQAVASGTDQNCGWGASRVIKALILTEWARC